MWIFDEKLNFSAPKNIWKKLKLERKNFQFFFSIFSKFLSTQNKTLNLLIFHNFSREIIRIKVNKKTSGREASDEFFAFQSMSPLDVSPCFSLGPLFQSSRVDGSFSINVVAEGVVGDHERFDLEK